MHDAVAEEVGVLEARNHAEHAALLRPGEVRLEAHEVIGRVVGVLGAELHHRPRTPARARVDETNGLHGPEARGIDASAGHLLDGLAGAEQIALLEILGDDAIGANELGDERLVLILVHRAVEVVAHAVVLVARLGEDDRAVEGIRVDDGRGGVKERERPRTDELGKRAGKRVRAQGASGDHAGALGDSRDLLAHELDERLGGNPLAYEAAKRSAVNGERAARGDGRLSGTGKQPRAHEVELGFEKPGRRLDPHGLERVRADELGKTVRVVCLRRVGRTLLVESHADAPRRKLQRALRARKTRPDHADRLTCPHTLPISRPPGSCVTIPHCAPVAHPP